MKNHLHKVKLPVLATPVSGESLFFPAGLCTQLPKSTEKLSGGQFSTFGSTKFAENHLGSTELAIGDQNSGEPLSGVEWMIFWL